MIPALNAWIVAVSFFIAGVIVASVYLPSAPFAKYSRGVLIGATLLTLIFFAVGSCLL